MQIADCIQWEKLGNHPREQYRFQIESAYIESETFSFVIEWSANFVMSWEDVERIRTMIAEEFPQSGSLKFKFTYRDVIQSAEEIVELAIGHMIYEVNGDYAHLTKTIQGGVVLEDDIVTIPVLGDSAADQLNQKVAGMFEKILARDFGLTVTCRFENDEEQYEEIQKKKEQQDAAELTAVKEAIAQAGINAISRPQKTDQENGGYGSSWNAGSGSFRRRQAYTPVEGNRIMGKPISGEAVRMRDVTEESENVIVEGRVFKMESRELKNGRILVTMLVTDETDSMCVKMFVGDRKFADLQEHISVKEGTQLRIRGAMEMDRFERVPVLMGRDIEKIEKEGRMDTAEEKRVELHAHTKASAMDGLMEVTDLVKTAIAWGHKAIAITDHGVVQSFPDAAKAAKKSDLKIIYGLEGYLVDDGDTGSQMPGGLTTSDEYVVFDLETTGLSPVDCEIIEIGAVKVKNKEIVDEFLTFVKPRCGHIPERITELTGIEDAMVADAPALDDIFDSFMEWIGDLPLVAHNADFDVSFVKMAASRRGRELPNHKVDTLYMSRIMLKQLKRHKLNQVADALGVVLENHHRAVDDARACAGILIKLFEKLEEKGVTRLSDMEKAMAGNTVDYKSKDTNHIILLAKTQEGLKNIYKLVSKSHLEYFYKRPRIPKSVLLEYREGLIIGSACEAGQIYRAFLENRTQEEIQQIAKLYDYFEIQPLSNNQFLVDKGRVPNVEALREINRKIVALGKQLGKPVVATCDAHYAQPEHAIYRQILMAGQGYKDVEDGAGLYLRTTDEMLEEFSYLGEDAAHQVVIDAPNAIADSIDSILPVPEGKFPPKIDGAEERLRERCLKTAAEMYGDPLPELVETRLMKELNSIISNGYAVMYVSAELLVQKSLSDGYLVGSRGSVGSSFAATMGGITEVNPLPPHYLCPNPECSMEGIPGQRYHEFIEDGSYDCGCDMPEKACPRCGTMMRREGYNIPFETFLGFDGDKEPDIDLNFAGEYQPRAHKFVEEIFGRENVFRAGTTTTVAEKTAFGYVKHYFEDRGKTASRWEEERLAQGCTGVRRSTGQHPGGIIIVPRGHEIYEFCPIQHPANDMTTDIITTHYDYHSIDQNLLKLDILGHDVPSQIRQLQDITGLDPMEVAMGDQRTMGIFTGIEGLDIKIPDYKFTHGTYGIPEFGTKFTRQMLDDTDPHAFADLVRISGFSHGTDVWINNAQYFIKTGQTTIKEAISTRDDIMNYLILKGVPKKASFKIMESVRKGKGLTEEQESLMVENNVPAWYIESCKRIKYMFPKAHAVAYTLMSYRIAYYKVYDPEAFYAVFFTSKIADFNADVILGGIDSIWDRIHEIEAKGKEATKKEEDEIIVLEVAYEMYARGFSFLPARLGESDGTRFTVRDGKVQLPFLALEGLGETAARNLAEEYEKGRFFSIEDMRERAKLNKTAVEALQNHGTLKGMDETNQISLFNL